MTGSRKTRNSKTPQDNALPRPGTVLPGDKGMMTMTATAVPTEWGNAGTG